MCLATCLEEPFGCQKVGSEILFRRNTNKPKESIILRIAIKKAVSVQRQTEIMGTA